MVERELQLIETFEENGGSSTGADCNILANS